MRRLGLWLGLTLLLLATGCGSTGGAAAPASLVRSPAATSARPLRKASLRLDFILAGYHAPYYLALERGFYKQAGIDLTIGQGQGSVTTAEVVANGSDTFGLVDGGAMMPLVAKGLKIRMVMGLFQKNATAIVSLAKEHIRTPQDLVGKRIAFYPGGSGPVLLKAFLAATHVPASEVHLVSATPQDGHALVQSGKVDGLLGYNYIDVPQFEAAGYPVTALNFFDYGIEVPEHGIVVSDRTLKQHPALVRAFVQATTRGFAAAIRDPQAALAALYAANPGTPLNHKAALQELTESLKLLHTQNTIGRPIGWMSAIDWTNGQNLLAKYGIIQHPEARISTYFSNAFLPSS